MSHLTFGLAAVLLVLAGAPAHAQSFSVGTGSVYAPYPVQTGTATFNSDVYSAGFYGRGTYLQALTGTDQQPGLTGDSASVRLLGADLFTGGNPPVFLVPGDLPVTLFVPVRLGASYRYVDVQVGTVSSTNHIAEATLGIGGGVGLDVPAALAAGLGTLTAETAFVLSAGATGEVSRPDPEPYAVRAGTFLVSLRVSNLLGSRLGAAVGYMHRASKRSGALASGGDFIEAITGSETLSDYETMNVVRVGLAF